MEHSRRNRIFHGVNVLVLGIVALVTVFPIYYVFVISFTETSEYLSKTIVLFPEHWSLESYRYLLSNPSMIRSVGVSAFLAVVGTLCSLVVTASLAYALSRKRLLGRRVALMLILFTILFSPGIIPNYMLVRSLGLIDNIWSLILPVLSSGWYVVLMKGFFENIPESLDEAAAIDGCNEVTAWFRIVLPLSMPAIAAFGLFYAVEYWNSYFSALLYMNDYQKWPIQVLLQNMLAENPLAEADPLLQPPPAEMLKMAAVVIATIPILCVYPFLQKHFAKGVMVGSVKG
ncbi:carbohydrate ABC transporter permease [Paenibacillus sp. H1-7]|uniref:carbohydrate ABC transporter permease n=1 Tax=Paenibacillus sp. H1-7 TaxID=2282849 RepID=UPI001EF788E5|nr:carbohydrate ABC transporter permease [Paenibacillus sp. H1-7]ULL14799.1 carbohydrate ABC transporter permease [Paenibacillus sp. H1-7]